MALQSGDIRFARSAVMADVDAGGGPPTSQLVPDGASNAIFPDISEDARTGGLVEIRHLHGVLRNTDTDALLGSNIIISEPPDDDGVSLTLVKSPGTFARRPDLVKIIEATSAPGSEFNGYLLENHTTSQRSINIAQRPGTATPSVNTSLVLVKDEGLITETLQYVRVRRVTVSLQTFTATDGQGNPVDFVMQVCACELFSELLHDFPGSPASRLFARATLKTKTRTVNVTDAGTFFSAARLTEATVPADMSVKLASVYTQLVPNTRTETPLLNQVPGGQRSLTLTDSQGSFEVSAASHTTRLAVTEANAGYSYVFKLTPPPAPNSIAFSYVALGAWGTVVDDGAGTLGGGPGSGTVLMQTGDLSLTTQALPDYNTFIVGSWASTDGYVNLAPNGPVAVTTAPPEFEVDIAPGSVASGAVVGWVSGGVAQSASANAAGVLSGGAAGNIVSALGKMYIRPTALPDPGTGFSLTYAAKPTLVENLAGLAVDAGGFAALTTAQEPIPGTLRVRWITARKVSATSGADLSGTSSGSTFNLGASLAGQIGRTTYRYSVGNSTYTEQKQSDTSDTQVIAHEINDDGAGGFGAVELGSVNYSGKTASLRLVTQGATTSSYRQDHEDASAFYSSGGVFVSQG